MRHLPVQNSQLHKHLRRVRVAARPPSRALSQQKAGGKEGNTTLAWDSARTINVRTRDGIPANHRLATLGKLVNIPRHFLTRHKQKEL
jgi:hypothetical protein